VIEPVVDSDHKHFLDGLGFKFPGNHTAHQRNELGIVIRVAGQFQRDSPLQVVHDTSIISESEMNSESKTLANVLTWRSG
jgi:hypothetical protein